MGAPVERLAASQTLAVLIAGCKRQFGLMEDGLLDERMVGYHGTKLQETDIARIIIAQPSSLACSRSRNQPFCLPGDSVTGWARRSGLELRLSGCSGESSCGEKAPEPGLTVFPTKVKECGSGAFRID